MDNAGYFELLSKRFDDANKLATLAKAKGFDPETFVEIRAAPDLAARVEGLIGLDGLAETIKKRMEGKSRPELAFEIVKEICTNNKYEMDIQKRITLAVRVGLSILTEGVLVAPTEGLQGVELHKNQDGTDYLAVLYAGPIRGAGGTSAALSVALADCARTILGVGAYKATKSEVERCIEEMLIYHTRCARLQYLPPEDDMRLIIENCKVCIDGVPTEEIEVGIHRNIRRLDANGKEQMLTNKIRGGVGLVVCEGIAQKAKSVLKHTKNAGLDWSWLNSVIKADKATASHGSEKEEKKDAVFLQELVAGRPVLAYPGYPGSFRLRYGRSRLTGIAAKGFSPATMYILDEFIATGTQVKVEKPGKGCIATPVDSIEGPFVKLRTGEAFRVNTVEQAKALKGQIAKIIAVGDMLVTYGDFKKSNTPLQPTSYVEEYWREQLIANGFTGEPPMSPSFREAYSISKSYNVPMHPRYIYDYSDLGSQELGLVGAALLKADVESGGEQVFDIVGIDVPVGSEELRAAIERLCIPHVDEGETIMIKGDDAQSLLCSLGFVRDEKLHVNASIVDGYDLSRESLDLVNTLAPFRVARRSTRIGARIGRPEKARERLMKPAPHILFPISEYGGKERNLYKKYSEDKRRFGAPLMDVETARYRCLAGHEQAIAPYCEDHQSRAVIERVCRSCGRTVDKDICPVCKTKTNGYDIAKINLAESIDKAMKNIGMQSIPKVMKGVKGLVSKDKIAEPIEKGLLRAAGGVYIFKDGTARFDATDTPMTHFYPKEIGTSVQKLIELGYTKDYLGEPLARDDQLVEMRHQDVILNKRGADYLFNVANYVDQLLLKFYKLEAYYNLKSPEDLVGHCVITLSPHTSCAVLGRVIGFTTASVGFAHPYTITARRRNCDGDEDTTMLLLDALINFSKSYLPVTIGGTMDAPLILTVNVNPDEVDDEVHAMEVVGSYGLAFYEKTMTYAPPGDVQIELVGNRLGKKEVYQGLKTTHSVGPSAVSDSPARSMYTKLKTMQEKIDMQFELMDRLCTIDKPDTARKLIISHFIPDLIGNLHSFSKQTFRCVNCNAKYRRVPLVGKCTRCDGKLVLTISKGGIEKYLTVAKKLAARYKLEPYIVQRIMLVEEEIEAVFGGVGGGEISTKQFNLASFM